jgi:hypothetical protein
MEHYSHKLRLHLYDSSILNHGGSCSGGHGKDLSIQNDTELQFCLSIFVLGYSFGPLWWAPLFELYGRFVVVQAASIGHVIDGSTAYRVLYPGVVSD